MAGKDEESEVFLRAPLRSLPATGVPVAGIHEYAELPSRKTTERDLVNFLNKCMTANRVNGCVIKAWWGEGKTDAYENLIEPFLEKKSQPAFETGATTVARVLERRQRDKLADAVAWIATLAAFLESIWEEGKLRPREVGVFQRLEKEMDSDLKYVQRVISKLTANERRLFLFLDELEQLENRPIKEDILPGIRGLFDQNVGFLKGVLHIIMACTPDAFNRLIGSSTQMGGLLERLEPIDLPHPSEEESARFVYGLVDYIYEGKTPSEHPFLNSGVAYAVLYAGHRSPRSMIKAFQQVIEYSKHLAAEDGHTNSLRKIDGSVALGALTNYKLPIFGTEVYALDGEIVDRINRMLVIEGEKERTAKLTNLVQCLIGEPIPHAIEEIHSRFKISEAKIRDLVAIANNRANETDLLNGLFILPMRRIVDSPTEIPSDVRRFIKPFVFRENKEGLANTLFFPASDRGLRSIAPEVELEVAKKYLRDLLRCNWSGDFLLISPELIGRIYPNPDFLELNFLVDPNKRMEFWKEANEKLIEHQVLSKCEETLYDLLSALSAVVEEE